MSVQTAPTQFTEIDSSKIAYRRSGRSNDSVPLLFITHFRGTMDLIDPLLVNCISKNREFIIFDSAGVGHSEGSIPDTPQGVAAIAVVIPPNLGITKADVMCFSMGGLIAHSITVEHRELVRKLILSGTQSRKSEGFAASASEIMQLAGGPSPGEEQMMKLFFYPTPKSIALGHAWWLRTQERQVEGKQRTTFVDQAGGQTQATANTKFVMDQDFFGRLKSVTIPVLIINGIDDVMTLTQNSWLMTKALPNARLHIYREAGHGHLYQFPEEYTGQLELFLSQ